MAKRKRKAKRKYQGNPLKHAGRHHNWLAKVVTTYAKRDHLDYQTAIADLIADLMHAADRFQADPNEAVSKAAEDYKIETSETCPCGAAYDPESTPERCEACGGSMDLVSCCKCGGRVLRTKAVMDQGEGDEAGREFAYCSERCRESH